MTGESYMQISSRVSLQTALITCVLLIVPVAVFPSRLGTELVRAAWSVILLEVLYYVVSSFVLFREEQMFRRLQVAGICLVYRLSVGAVFGLVVTASYGMSLTVGLRLGMISYLPAVILHVLAAPYALRGVLASPTARRNASRRAVVRPPQTKEAPSGMTSIAISKEKGIVSESTAGAPYAEQVAARPISARLESQTSSQNVEPNGFDRAVRYVGEHGSVFLVAIVDNEGLLLANFRRGNYQAEDWAPLALVFLDVNTGVLIKNRLTAPEKIDLVLKDKRVVIARDTMFSLLVLSERVADETLNIRINQAMDMIRRYAAERYGRKSETNAEKIHVSSTQ
jgi:hypothetical protein